MEGWGGRNARNGHSYPPPPPAIRRRCRQPDLYSREYTVVLSLHHGGSKISAAVNEALFARYFTKDGLPQESYPMLAQAFTDYSNNKYKTLQDYDLENLPTLKGLPTQRKRSWNWGTIIRAFPTWRPVSREKQRFRCSGSSTMP